MSTSQGSDAVQKRARPAQGAYAIIADDSDGEKPVKPKAASRRHRRYEPQVDKPVGPLQVHVEKSKPKKWNPKKKVKGDEDRSWTPGAQSAQASKKAWDAKWKKEQKTKEEAQAVNEKLAQERLNASAASLSLTRLLALPLELLFEIFKDFDIYDLLYLSNCSPALATILDDPNGASLWRKACDAVKIPAVRDADDMGEKELVTFLALDKCQECGNNKADVIDFFIRLRICDACSAKTEPYLTKKEADKLKLHPFTIKCTPSTTSLYPGLPSSGDERWPKADLLQMSSELYEFEKEDSAAGTKKRKGKGGAATYGPKVLEFATGRELVVKIYAETAPKLKETHASLRWAADQRQWANRLQDSGVAVINKRFVGEKAKDLGYRSCTVARAEILGLPVVNAPKLFTEKDWEKYGPTIVARLEKDVFDSRESLRKMSLVPLYQASVPLSATPDRLFVDGAFSPKIDLVQFLHLPSIKPLWKNDNGSLHDVPQADIDAAADHIPQELADFKEHLRFRTIAHILHSTEERVIPKEWLKNAPAESLTVLPPDQFDEEWFDHPLHHRSCSASCGCRKNPKQFRHEADSKSADSSAPYYGHPYSRKGDVSFSDVEVGTQRSSSACPESHYDTRVLQSRKKMLELAGMAGPAEMNVEARMDQLGAVFRIDTEFPNQSSRRQSWRMRRLLILPGQLSLHSMRTWDQAVDMLSSSYEWGSYEGKGKGRKYSVLEVKDIKVSFHGPLPALPTGSP